MNKRDEELAEQADNIEILPDGEFYDTDFLADIDPRRVKKFAELIVRECLLKVNGAKIRSESMDELIERIKEDFGVEE